MLLIAVLIAIAPAEMTGFWHSEPDLSQGYQSCYFFWEHGEYAYLESIQEGVVYMGDWYLEGDDLVLIEYDAMMLDGTPLDVDYSEEAFPVSMERGEKAMITFDGDTFYQLSDDPDGEILSLVPTWGMSYDERDAFSTYD